MPKQRGVKKRAHRHAGPYEIIPRDLYSEPTDFNRVRHFCIVRRCTPFANHNPTFRVIYGDRDDKFGELMQAMRALFRIERELRGKKTGVPWQDITLSEKDMCREFYSLTFGFLGRKRVRMKIDEMEGETADDSHYS